MSTHTLPEEQSQPFFTTTPETDKSIDSVDYILKQTMNTNIIPRFNISDSSNDWETFVDTLLNGFLNNDLEIGRPSGISGTYTMLPQDSWVYQNKEKNIKPIVGLPLQAMIKKRREKAGDLHTINLERAYVLSNLEEVSVSLLADYQITLSNYKEQLRTYYDDTLQIYSGMKSFFSIEKNISSSTRKGTAYIDTTDELIIRTKFIDKNSNDLVHIALVTCFTNPVMISPNIHIILKRFHFGDSSEMIVS